MKALSKTEVAAFTQSFRENQTLTVHSEPLATHRLVAMVRNVVKRVRPRGLILVEMKDWPLYQPDEMAVVQAVRRSFGETRLLTESPGHLGDHDERELSLGLFGLSIAYGWDSHLYFSAPSLRLFNWEGEILEFWAEEKEVFEDMRDLCKSCDFPIREKA